MVTTIDQYHFYQILHLKDYAISKKSKNIFQFG